MSASAPVPGRLIARDLLESGAVIIRPNEPFTWASGIKAPIYCDNRVTLSIPHVRRHITNGLLRSMREREITADAVAGVATAGIPQAALLADRVNLPLVYVRPEAKAHGRMSRIEGRIAEGARTIVVEDLISTGGSSLKAVTALIDAGVEVEAVLAVFSYGLSEAAEAFRAAQTELITLATLDDLLTEAAASGRMTDNEVKAVRRWRQNPTGWSGS